MLPLNFGKLCNILQETKTGNVWTPPIDEEQRVCIKEKMTQVDAVNILYSLVWRDEDLVTQLGYLNMNPENANLLFKNNRGVHASIREQAKKVPFQTVRENFYRHIFLYMTEDERRNFWEKTQVVLRDTPMGSDPLRLEDFSSAQYADENLCNFAVSLLIWCLLAPNCANEKFLESNISLAKRLPTDGTQNYDPHNLTDHLSNSKAIQIMLLLESGKNKIFHASERAVEYVQKKALIITGFQFEKGIIKAYCKFPSVKCTLSRLEKTNYAQATALIRDHLLEFKPKCTWNGQLLCDMADQGLKSEIWTAYAYYDEAGAIIAYLDYKQRSDSGVELGIQLVEPNYRQKNFATGLINFFRLKFLDNRFFAGTYEENTEMRHTLLKCGFQDNDFLDLETEIKINKIRERIDETQPESRQAMTNSVYYCCNSLMCRTRLRER